MELVPVQVRFNQTDPVGCVCKTENTILGDTIWRSARIFFISKFFHLAEFWELPEGTRCMRCKKVQRYILNVRYPTLGNSRREYGITRDKYM